MIIEEIFSNFEYQIDCVTLTIQMKFITGLLVVLSLLVFGSVFISPEVFPYVGLLPFLVPVVLFANLFLFFMLALAWRRLAFFH